MRDKGRGAVSPHRSWVAANADWDLPLAPISPSVDREKIIALFVAVLEAEKQRWRRELAQSQEQVRAIATSGSDSHSFR